MSMHEAVEELIKISAMYGLCSVGTAARFTGAVLRGDRPAARILWIAELRNVASHMDDIFNAEIEQWLVQ